MRAVLSVDVAKNKSMIMLMNNEGEILIDTKEIKRNLGEFEKVKEEIEKCSGTQFDPNIAKVFLGILETQPEEIERIRQLDIKKIETA